MLSTPRLDQHAPQQQLSKLGLRFERLMRSPNSKRDGSRDLQLYAWQEGER
jgi:hypothetical protein